MCIPLRRIEKVNKRSLDNKCFHNFNYRTGFFDQFLNAWASYCDGTQEDAANMILHYMAKQFPQCYLQHTHTATSYTVKSEECEVPNNFVSYDGTYDVKWNTKYAELVEVS